MLHGRAGYYLQPVEGPTQEQMDIPKGTAGGGKPMLEGKGVRRKEEQRGTVTY